MMPQFYVVKDGKHFSLPPFLFGFSYVAFLLSSCGTPSPLFVFDLLVLLLGHERMIPFEMVLRGNFQGACLHREISLVEALPPPVNIDHALALSGPTTSLDPMSDPRAGPVLVDAPIGDVDVSQKDPFSFRHRGGGLDWIGET